MLRETRLRTLMTAVLWAALSGTLSADRSLVFNTTAPTNDLQGSLAAQVLFAQSQIVPARVREGDRQPHLIGHRTCLVLVRPLTPDDATPMQIAAVDKHGTTLGILDLDPPAQLPKTAYSLDGLPEEPIAFEPHPGAVVVISVANELERVGQPGDTFLHEQLRKHALVEIQTADGQWVRDIHFPKDTDLEGKMVRVRSNAGYASTIHYSGRTAVIARGQTLQFKAVRGQWVSESEPENQRLTYAAATWSGVLPADWIVPGVTLRFHQGDLRGQLVDLEIGAPSELLLHTIDVGMLVPPRGRFTFANDPTAHREYFQTVPASRMIVSQYAPVFLRQVMLPNGTLLTEQNPDPGTGGWHHGTMRQHIGKELISHGINNANYGIHCTAGEGEGGHPYLVAQLTAHNSSGKYSNGIVTHGGSGGGGIVTLDDTLGNEFSHEVGHNYGLGHYVGGFLGSVHRDASQINSTWGWDADKRWFLPNFSPTPSGKDTCVGDQCQSPFHGRPFGLDAMAGGAPLSHLNRFTLYTPYSAAIIQTFLESKAVFDARSPTGFRKWNADTCTMDPYHHTIDVAEQIDAPMARGITGSDASDGKRLQEGRADSHRIERKPQAFGVPVTTLVGYYDPRDELVSYIYPALHGAYGFTYADDRGRVTDHDCHLLIESREGTLRFRLANHRIIPNVMNKFHVNVPESIQPRSVSIVCRGKVVDKKVIAGVTDRLTHTVHGE